MIFKIILNCFFPSFNSKIETSKIETWVICEHTTHPPRSPTQHTNTPTDPPKTKTLITHKHTTHKHTTHNPQTHNTQHKHRCGCTTGPKKYIYIYIYIVMSAGV